MSFERHATSQAPHCRVTMIGNRRACATVRSGLGGEMKNPFREDGPLDEAVGLSCGLAFAVVVIVYQLSQLHDGTFSLKLLLSAGFWGLGSLIGICLEIRSWLRSKQGG
jgi:hypothetical protein